MDERVEVVSTRPLVSEFAPGPIRRVSWGAIIAGAVMVIMVQMLLTLLGLGIGMSTVEPATEQNPLEGLGAPALAWWIGSVLISLLVGGLVAGRLAGVPRRLDGALHGVLAWAIAILLMLYLIATAAGNLMGGALGILQGTLNVAGRTAQVVAPAVQQAPPEVTEKIKAGIQEKVQDIKAANAADLDAAWNKIRADASQTLQQNARPVAEPRPTTDTAATTPPAEVIAQPPAANPRQTEEEFQRILDRLLRQGDEVSPQDREAAVIFLTANTTLSRPEAETTVDRWSRTYTEAKTPARAQVQQTATEVKEEIKEQTPAMQYPDREGGAVIAEKAAETTAQASLWAFGMLLAGLLAAAIGGAVGAPRDLLIERVR